MQEIDVASINGIEIGRNYTITDGINSENVVVESIRYEDGRYRVRLTERIQNHYLGDGSDLLRFWIMGIGTVTSHQSRRNLF